MSRSREISLAAIAAVVSIAVTVVALRAGHDPQSRESRPPLAQPGDSSSPPPRDFAGIVSEDTFAGNSGYRSRALGRQADVGIALMRQTFDWARIETAAGRYEFDYYDDYVADLARHGMELLPVLFGSPSFRSSAPSTGARPGTYPPRDEADFARFAAAVARRYGAGGSFWEQHPQLRGRPVRAWQIWNEPSLPAFWASGPDPAEYARLLAAAGRAIRQVDPRAEIVTAGLPESRLGIPFREFVAGLYRAGGKHSFDTLAIHPYARDVDGVLAAVEAARDLMNRNGDGRKQIWVTELGWASEGPGSPFTVGRSGQAKRIRDTVSALAARRSELGLRGFVYFNWKDAPPYAGGKDFWGLHTGLLDIDGQAKPALPALGDAVGRLKG